jgi:hypothetical protein
MLVAVGTAEGFLPVLGVVLLAWESRNACFTLVVLVVLLVGLRLILISTIPMSTIPFT